MKNVAVIGGGLSGLAASVTLAKHKVKVTLIEAERRLGGQAAAWKDKDGDVVETIHLIFPWYYNFLNLYQSIGAPLPLVQTRGDFHILDGKTRTIKVLRSNPFSTWESIQGLRTFPDFTPQDVRRLLKFLVWILKTPLNEFEEFDGITVSEFLETRNLSSTLKNFLALEPVTIQGLRADEASAASFLKFMKVMYGSQGKCFLSFFQAPTAEVLVSPLVNFLMSHGAQIQLSKRVEKLNLSRFDDTVLALPAYTAAELMKKSGVQDQAADRLARLKPTPIICLQLWYKDKVFPDGNVYISNRQGVLFDAVCDKTYHWKKTNGWGSIIQVLVDAADDVESLSDETILQLTLGDLARFFPGCRGLFPDKTAIIRLHQTYAGTRPGYWSAVPRNHKTMVDNLYLAGDYTSPPYHYGMESAVRSGIETANLILQKYGLPQEPVEEIEFPWIIRTLEKLL